MESREIKIFHGKHLVVGVGTVPFLPDFVKEIRNPNIFHSSEYLFKKEELLCQKKIMIVGSGQSAAEIFYDLLQTQDGFETLDWFTRSGFYPMDYSRFSLEMTSPDYVDHFYHLSPSKKKEILAGQDMLYKGINLSLIDDINNELCDRSFEEKKGKATLHPNCVLHGVETAMSLITCRFHHANQEEDFTSETNCLILATGYKNITPGFLQPVKDLINWNLEGLYEVNRNYSIDNHNSIFVQNADLHSHGFNSADLGLGPYRNATILNTILNSEYFKMEKNITFQTFGMPEN